MDIRSSQLSSNRDPQTVKTHVRIAVFQANSFQEVEPSFRGTLWADIGLRYSSFKHFPEHRDKLLMEPGYVCLAALCSEYDAPIFQINVSHWIKVSFGQTTTLVTSDFKTVQKECSGAATRFENAVAYGGHIIGSQRSFDFADGALQPKLTAWIGGRVTTANCLFHNQSERFEFKYGGVMSGFVFANAFVSDLAPFDVSVTIFSAKSAWAKDFPFSEEQADCSPSNRVAQMTLRIVGVAFVEERCNPCRPTLSGDNAETSPLLRTPLTDQPVSKASILGAANAEASTLVTNFPAEAPILDPPKGTSTPPVDASHVSPNVTTETKTCKH